MRIILTIIFFSFSSCFSQAQIKYVKGVSVNGADALYTATNLPMVTTVATSLNKKADSLKTLYTMFKDYKNSTDKVIKILRDSVKFLASPDSTFFKGLIGTGTKKNPYEWPK